jgi:hypothetical protein
MGSALNPGPFPRRIVRQGLRSGTAAPDFDLEEIPAVAFAVSSQIFAKLSCKMRQIDDEKIRRIALRARRG